MTDKKQDEPVAEDMTDDQLMIHMLIEALERLDTIETFLREFLLSQGFQITEDVMPPKEPSEDNGVVLN